MKEVLNAAGGGGVAQHREKILRDSSWKEGGVVTTKLMERSDAGDQEPSKQHPGP